MKFTEFNSVLPALAPDADRYNGDPDTDIFSLENYSHITFVLSEGAGGTGTAKIVATASDDNAGSSTEAIAAKYRTWDATNGWGDLTTLATTGYTTVAGANKIVVVEIDAQDLPAGKPFVYLDLTEVANDPCDAGILAILSGARYPEADPVDPLS